MWTLLAAAAVFMAGIGLYNKLIKLREWADAAWADVAQDEAKADRDFKRVWESLKAFRQEYSIWKELSLPY